MSRHLYIDGDDLIWGGHKVATISPNLLPSVRDEFQRSFVTYAHARSNQRAISAIENAKSELDDALREIEE